LFFRAGEETPNATRNKRRYTARSQTGYATLRLQKKVLRYFRKSLCCGPTGVGSKPSRLSTTPRADENKSENNAAVGAIRLSFAASAH
ncbi:hypothetical protein, partial [Pseudorhodoplanes sinuspersici]|uniref:hypothetical protein n=1 Tax=Pseudorhodoplanes sinuspersici TaxID=1235591 RepID=UPI001AECC5D0